MDQDQNELPRRSEHAQEVPESGNQACPFLGTCNDRQTRYSFPETLNCCHRVRRPTRVDLDYQGDVCLTGAYQTCPVYSAEWKGPLPKELRGRYYQPQRASRLGIQIGAVALVVLAIGLIYARWAAGQGANADPSTAPAAAALSSSATPTAGPSDTPTAVVLTATEESPTLNPTPQATPTATVTPTPTTGPLANTPFGPNGRYIVYKVNDGDMLENLAKLYHTTTQVLKTLNGLKPEAGFWPGMTAVVAVGEVNPNNVFPMQAVWLDKPEQVVVLAAKYATSVDELRAFNSLGAEDKVPGGRWIIARKK